MRKHIQSKEQKLAKLILDKLADLTLDLEAVGFYIALNVSGVLYNRFQVVAETTFEEKDKQIATRHTIQ
jgi:hypothetical protein